jgi:ribosome-binding factor A
MLSAFLTVFGLLFLAFDAIFAVYGRQSIDNSQAQGHICDPTVITDSLLLFQRENDIFPLDMSAFRMKRVNEQVKRELSDLIRKYLPVEEYGLISVTDVDVSKDLKTANIFVSNVGVSQQPEGLIDALNRVRVELQRDLSKKVIMKYTPHLLFKEDAGLERGQQVVDILDDLERGQKA